MPTIKLAQPTSRDRLRDILTTRCPDLELKTFGPNLVAARTRWTGAMVTLSGRRVGVIPSVGSVGMMLAMLLIMLTGIGLVIYAVAVIPKQQAVARRVAAALEQELLPPGR